MKVHNLKLFSVSNEQSLFRNSEFCIQKINDPRSWFLGCLAAGSMVSKPDKGLDVRQLCLLCVAYVGISATS